MIIKGLFKTMLAHNIFRVRKTCDGCKLSIPETDLIMKALDFTFHQSCFKWSLCDRLINEGTKYYIFVTLSLPPFYFFLFIFKFWPTKDTWYPIPNKSHKKWKNYFKKITLKKWHQVKRHSGCIKNSLSQNVFFFTK